MAATTISHNKPAAGSISWTAFNIAYNGANFTVPAGNTAAKFVWWVYNAGTPKLMSGDVLPTLTADDTVLFLNKQGIGQLLPETSVMDGSLIVEESIYAQAIASDQIATRHIQADAVTADQIAANSVTAEQLSVGTVSANLVANGSFEDYDADGNVIGWEALQMQGGTMSPVAGVASSGAIAVQFNATATTALLRLSQKPDQFIPVSNASSRRWYVSARMGAGTAITKGAHLRAVWYDANKNRLTSGDYVDVGRSNAALTTTFTVYEGQVAPPAAARYMAIEIILNAPNVVTKMYVDEVTVSEVVVSAVIADGAITANKVAAKAITADKLTIADSTNLLTDPGLAAGGSGWNLGGAATIVTVPTAEIRNGSVSTKALQFTANGTLKELTTDALPAEGGEWYHASCWVRATTTTTSSGTVGIAATVRQQGKGDAWPTFQTVAANTITAQWQKLEGKIELPTGTTTFSLRPAVRDNVASGVFQFTDFTLRRMNGGELVVDGAIKTNHMTANTISGDVIAANTLVGTKIMADSITSRELLADEIWANSAWITAIQGKTITGATVRTASSGARVELNKDGLKGYAADGSTYLDASAGKMNMQGTLTVQSNSDYDNALLETKVGLTTAKNIDGTEGTAPGVEFGRKFESGMPVGWRPARVTTASGLDLQMRSGKDAANTLNPNGISGVELRGGNVYLTHENSGRGRGTHSDGHYTALLGDQRRRIPLGLLHYWTNNTAINLVKDTQLWQGTVLLPAYSFTKVTVSLRGYPNVDLQWLDMRAFANGQTFGRFVHYSPTGWNSNDATIVFMYRHTSTADANVTFRVTGTNVVPTDRATTFLIPAPGAGGPPSTEILVEDMGSLNSSLDPLSLNS